MDLPSPSPHRVSTFACYFRFPSLHNNSLWHFWEKIVICLSFLAVFQLPLLFLLLLLIGCAKQNEMMFSIVFLHDTCVGMSKYEGNIFIEFQMFLFLILFPTNYQVEVYDKLSCSITSTVSQDSKGKIISTVTVSNIKEVSLLTLHVEGFFLQRI